MKRKNWLSALLAVMMVISMVACIALPVTAETSDLPADAVWVQDVATASEDVVDFYIKDAADMVWLSNTTNLANFGAGDTIYMKNDIDVSAYDGDFATDFLGFSGTVAWNFDGLGHTLSNYVNTRPIFNGNNDATIKNLTINSAIVTGSAKSILVSLHSDVAGTLLLFNNVHICHSSLTSTVCANLGAFYGGTTTSYKGTLSFVNCSVNDVTVTSTTDPGTGNQGIGLFAGANNAEATADFMNFSNCVAYNSHIIAPSVRETTSGNCFGIGFLCGFINNRYNDAEYDNVAIFNCDIQLASVGTTPNVAIFAPVAKGQSEEWIVKNIYLGENSLVNTTTQTTKDLDRLFVTSSTSMPTVTYTDIYVDETVTYLLLNNATSPGTTEKNLTSAIEGNAECTVDATLTIDSALKLMNKNEGSTYEYLDWKLENGVLVAYEYQVTAENVADLPRVTTVTAANAAAENFKIVDASDLIWVERHMRYFGEGDTLYFANDINVSDYVSPTEGNTFADDFNGFTARVTVDDEGASSISTTNANNQYYTFYFELDGLGHTLYNYTETQAFFSGEFNSTLRNLTFENASVTANAAINGTVFAPCIIARSTNGGAATFENVHIKDSNLITSASGTISAFVGYGNALVTFLNCSVTSTKIESTSALVTNIGLYHGRSYGNLIMKNCIATDSSIVAPEFDAGDSSAMLVALVANGKATSLVFDNIGVFNCHKYETVSNGINSNEALIARIDNVASTCTTTVRNIYSVNNTQNAVGVSANINHFFRAGTGEAFTTLITYDESLVTVEAAVDEDGNAVLDDGGNPTYKVLTTGITTDEDGNVILNNWSNFVSDHIVAPLKQTEAVTATVTVTEMVDEVETQVEREVTVLGKNKLHGEIVELTDYDYKTALTQMNANESADDVAYVDWYFAENATTGTKYLVVSDALADAKSGETVKPLVGYQDVIVDGISVNDGVTLDLNGKELAVQSIAALGTGEVKDSTDGNGGLAITGSAESALNPDNAQLPLYDTEKGYYRFFDYELVSAGNKEVDANTVKFGYRLNFTGSGSTNAYTLLADTENASGMTFKIDLSLSHDSVTYNYNVEYGFKASTVAQYAGYKLDATKTPAFVLTVSGLNILAEGTVINTAPQVITTLNVAGVGDTNPYTYTVA